MNVYSTGPNAVLFDTDASYTNMISSDFAAMIERTVSYKNYLNHGLFLVCADQDYWSRVHKKMNVDLMFLVKFDHIFGCVQYLTLLGSLELPASIKIVFAISLVSFTLF